jgi:hypothetical protein
MAQYAIRLAALMGLANRPYSMTPTIVPNALRLMA